MQKREKNKPLVWSNQAIKDLEHIFDYLLKNHTHDLATDVIEKILTEVETISEFPRKGKISQNYNEIRELVVESNTIYYRNNESDIVIASIRAKKNTDKKTIF